MTIQNALKLKNMSIYRLAKTSEVPYPCVIMPFFDCLSRSSLSAHETIVA